MIRRKRIWVIIDNEGPWMVNYKPDPETVEIYWTGLDQNEADFMLCRCINLCGN